MIPILEWSSVGAIAATFIFGDMHIWLKILIDREKSYDIAWNDVVRVGTGLAKSDFVTNNFCGCKTKIFYSVVNVVL